MSRSDPGAGFTLLEVLAAVAILGVLYTVLAGIAIQGLRTEGESKRQLEASLLADSRLAALEAEIDAGGTPELGVQEDDDGVYRVSVEVVPFAVPAAALPGEEAPPATAEPDESSPLRAIHLAVSWQEGDDERSVARTTYALNSDALKTAQAGGEGQP